MEDRQTRDRSRQDTDLGLRTGQVVLQMAEKKQRNREQQRFYPVRTSTELFESLAAACSALQLHEGRRSKVEGQARRGAGLARSWLGGHAGPGQLGLHTGRRFLILFPRGSGDRLGLSLQVRAL